MLVCSYGLLHQSAELLAGRHWQMAVLDEAQAIKNAETKRAQASMALQAGFRLALTGTPVENYLDELWSLFSFVNPGLLGSREGFQKRFAGPIERDHDAQARQALRALVRPFLLRRTKAAVLTELPPRTEQTIQVEMDEAERGFYEALRQRRWRPSPRWMSRPANARSTSWPKSPGCAGPAAIRPDRSRRRRTKRQAGCFLELVDELVRNRHKALVFSQFAGLLDLVRTALDAARHRYKYLDGRRRRRAREPGHRVPGRRGGAVPDQSAAPAAPG